MKKLLNLIFILASLTVFSQTQNPYLEWEQTYGGSHYDYLFSTIPTSDGGYLLSGFTKSNDGDIQSGNHGSDDFWVVKIDSAGTIEWEQTYGGSDDDWLFSTIPTSDGGYLLGGFTKSNDGDVQSGNHGQRDFWVVKIDSNGTIEWEQTYGGSSGDYLRSTILTSDGGYLLGGYTYSNDGDIQSGNHGSYDFWVVKISSTGTIEWEQTYGGSSEDNLYSTILTSDGGYILCGRTSSNDGDIQSGNYGYFDSWVVKINSSGTIEWEQTYGGSNYDNLSSTITTSDGGYLLGGATSSNDGDIQSGLHGSMDCWVVKIDSTGTIEWEQTYGGSDWESLRSTIPTSDGGYLLGGTTQSNDGDIESGNHGSYDFWVVKINSTGIIEWEQTYGGTSSEHLNSTIPTSDGGYLLGGYTSSNDGDIQSGNHGSDDFWVVKMGVNNFPTDITLSDSTIDENLPVGTEIGTLTSTDEDTGDIHTYSLVLGDGDTDNDSFTISGDTLKSGVIFDYEGDSIYSIRIQTDDGNSGTFSKSFLIFVNDVNDSQTIGLWGGWNIMSFYVEPDDINLLTILDPLVTSTELTKVINEAGGFIQYIPGLGWMNTIGDMANTEGYYIKVTATTSFDATGMPVSLPINIPLSTGWNIMGYPIDLSQDAITILQPLINDSELIKVINEAGGFIQYIPGVGWMNTIGDFDPGEGYYIKVNADATLTIESVATSPTLTTTSISNVTQTTATSGGDVTSDGGATVSARGVCWSTTTNPTTADSHTTDGTGTGTFVSNLTGLTGGTFYYVRAYATNSVGTAYGNEVSFTTADTSVVAIYYGKSLETIVTESIVLSTFIADTGFVGSWPTPRLYDNWPAGYAYKYWLIPNLPNTGERVIGAITNGVVQTVLAENAYYSNYQLNPSGSQTITYGLMMIDGVQYRVYRTLLKTSGENVQYVYSIND